jgi:hypothetical protein
MFKKISPSIQKTLYIPGLTYLEALRYAARLRLVNSTSAEIEKRVQDALTIMDLNRCKNRVIPDFPPVVGELGCDLRLLSIATEIVGKYFYTGLQ